MYICMAVYNVKAVSVHMYITQTLVLWLFRKVWGGSTRWPRPERARPCNPNGDEEGTFFLRLRFRGLGLRGLGFRVYGLYKVYDVDPCYINSFS